MVEALHFDLERIMCYHKFISAAVLHFLRLVRSRPAILGLAQAIAPALLYRVFVSQLLLHHSASLLSFYRFTYLCDVIIQQETPPRLNRVNKNSIFHFLSCFFFHEYIYIYK